MGKINILDKHVAELIAAGEVVERPSSVIKELVENSIDAGASSIIVETKNGGISYMRITDNGCGIEKSDVRKAFLRNATSKVCVEDDLDKIATLGFRGEALASVCAVSKVELITKTKDETLGTVYQINGGEEVLFEDIGAADGTNIVVRDLFYNIPARMKFLKKDISESNAVAKVMDFMALSNPNISFKYIRDGKQVLTTPGDGKLLSAIYSVYGKDFIKNLIEVNYSLNGVKVSGYISSPSFVRANRNMQHFFINGRYVKTKTAAAALEEAFKGSIMVQKFPCCVLYIDVPFETVDVNVHPSKIEVRFIDEKPIFSAVYHAVKSALLKEKNPLQIKSDSKDYKEVRDLPVKPNKENIVPSVTEKTVSESLHREVNVNVKSEPEPEIFIPKKEKILSFRFNDINKETKPVNLDFDKYLRIEKNQALTNTKDKKIEVQKDFTNEKNSNKKDDNVEKVFNKKPNLESVEKKESKIEIIGEVFNTYIVIQKDNDILYIDKHAAHERLIYENLLSKSKKMDGQVLLVPVVVTLGKDEYNAVLTSLDSFSKAGFEIDDFGTSSVIVRQAPMYLNKEDIEDTVIEMAGYILENKQNINCSKLEWLYKNIACRAAIKAGNLTSREELKVLINKLIENDIKYCPHGRPIFIKFTKKDIEKEFGRA